MKICSFVVLCFAVLLGGCFGRNKPSPTIAAEVEEAFKQRWIAKRMAELQASGVSDPRQARLQATEEFRKKYEYINSARVPDPVAGSRP
jgi:hypothetical protein